MALYKVIGTSKGQTAEFITNSPTAPKAILEARRMAKAKGMGRITVNSVQGEPAIFSEEETQRLNISHGRSLSLAEISAEIERVLGIVPLKAYEENGSIFLSDGISAPAEVEDRTLIGLMELFYDWAVFVGYTNEDFEDFLAMAE